MTAQRRVIKLLFTCLLCLAFTVYPSASTQASVAAAPHSRPALAAQPLGDVVSLAAGEDFFCALTRAGSVLCWGNNYVLGTGGEPSLPGPISGLTSGVKMIAAGRYHACALTAAGGVKCWGYDYYGVMGTGAVGSQPTPVDVAGLSSGVTAITAKGDHTCALTSAGAVKCWGENSAGQVGSGSASSDYVLLPADVVGLSGGVTGIAAAEGYTCAIMATGGVKCWGDNSKNTLGSTGAAYSATPVDVPGLPGAVARLYPTDNTVYAVTTGGANLVWGSGDAMTGAISYLPRALTRISSPITALTASFNPYADARKVCAVIAGGVVCWGSTGSLALSPDSITGLAGSAQAVATGTQTTCALLTSGQVQCWGDNHFGQLGDGRLIEALVPLEVGGLPGRTVDVAAADNFSCALNHIGELYGGGRGPSETPSTAKQTAPTTPKLMKLPAQPLTAIWAKGEQRICGIACGAAVCWGDRFIEWKAQAYGRDDLPLLVPDLASGVTALALGTSHGCALVAGGVNCWGSNDYNQLGRGFSGGTYTAGAVPGLSSGVRAIAAGDLHTCALTQAGKVKCWGGDKPLPTLVDGLSGVRAISANGFTTCALLAGGEARCWGGQVNNVSGLLPAIDNLANNRWDAACGVGGGRIQCWGPGVNTYGYGMRTASDPWSPFGLADGVQKMAFGADHACALVSGAVKCWGVNWDGQLGQGGALLSKTPVFAAAGLAPVLYLDYSSAQPGSVLTLVGRYFAPNANLAVSVNGATVIAHVITGPGGEFAARLDTTGADPGAYVISVEAGGPAARLLVLDPAAPLRARSKELYPLDNPLGLILPGSGLPAQWLYLPGVSRR